MAKKERGKAKAAGSMDAVVTIKVPEHLAVKLVEMAEARCQPKSVLVREAVVEYLRSKEVPA